MPRFDKTGPNGAGAKTGWGRGVCNDGSTPTYQEASNLGRGMGRGKRCFSGNGSFMSIEDEKEYLKKRLEAIEKNSK